jgi:hypothetical protein
MSLLIWLNKLIQISLLSLIKSNMSKSNTE